MMSIQFSEDEYDQLKEIFNLAMGKAGSSLAKLLKAFLDLSVPDIKMIKADDIIDTVLKDSMFDENEIIVSTHQSFYSTSDIDLDGETVVLFNDETRDHLSEILGVSVQKNSVEEKDFMLEMSNLIVGACMNSLSEQLFNQDLGFSQPILHSENISLRKMVFETFKRRNIQWEYTLLTKIAFKLKEKRFKSDLLIFMSEKAIQSVYDAIVKLLDEE